MFDRLRLRWSLDGRCARAELGELHAQADPLGPKTPAELRAEAELWRRMGEPQLAAMFDEAAVE